MYIYDTVSFSTSSVRSVSKLYRKLKHTFHVQELFDEMRVVYEITWYHMVQQDRKTEDSVMQCMV
jgi:hypothetical protein